MKTKISIIGAGHVGSHVASSLLTLNVCEEIAIIDIDEKKALAQAIDLADMSSYIESDALVYFGDYSDLKNSDIVFISACGSLFSEDRLLELADTIEVIDEIIPNILSSGFNGIIISISNPCDIVAQYIKEKTKLNVIGTGTILDSARFKTRLSNALNISTKSINGFVLGEHGDSQFVAESLTSINGIALKDYLELNDIDLDMKSIESNVCEAGWDIVVGKGSTEFGIGASAAYLARAILNDENKVLPCSTYVQEKGVYVSVPCLIGKRGVTSQVKFKLTDKEQVSFDKSCDILKENFTKII